MRFLAGAAGGTGKRSLCLHLLADALGDRISVDSQRFGSLGEMFLVSGESLLDVEALEFVDCLAQKDVAIQHLVDQSFKSRTHVI